MGLEEDPNAPRAETVLIEEGATVNVLRLENIYPPIDAPELRKIFQKFKSSGKTVVNEYIKPEWIPDELKKTIVTLDMDVHNVSTTFKEASAFAGFDLLETLILEQSPGILNHNRLVDNVSLVANQRLKLFKMTGEVLDKSSLEELIRNNEGIKLELVNDDDTQLGELIGNDAVMTSHNIKFKIEGDVIDIEIPENHTPPAVIKKDIFKYIEMIDKLTVRVKKNKINTYFDDVWSSIAGVNNVRHLTCLHIKSSAGELINVILNEVQKEKKEEAKEGEEKRLVLETLTFTTEFPKFAEQSAFVQNYQKKFKHRLSNLTQINMIVTNHRLSLDSVNLSTLGVKVNNRALPGETVEYLVIEIPISNKKIE